MFAASGTLLLVHTDESSELERMRTHLRTSAPGACPRRLWASLHAALSLTHLRCANNRTPEHLLSGAPQKQAGIIHTTLLRVLTPVQLPRSVIEAIQTRCQHWTQELRGTKLCITRVW